jgi:hypothetical protein
VTIGRHLGLWRGTESIADALEPLGIETVQIAYRPEESWPKADLLTTNPVIMDERGGPPGGRSWAPFVEIERDSGIRWALFFGCGDFLHNEAVLPRVKRHLRPRGYEMSYGLVRAHRGIVPIVFGPARIDVSFTGPMEVPDDAPYDFVPAELTRALVERMRDAERRQ